MVINKDIARNACRISDLVADNNSKPIFLSMHCSLSFRCIKNTKFAHELLAAVSEEDTVLLCFENNILLATAILLLDGLVKGLVICSERSNNARYNEIYNRTSSTRSVSDIEDLDPQAKILSLADLTQRVGFSIQESKSCSNTRWIISTSGTTGTPKLVKHSSLSLLDRTRTTTDKQNHVWAMLYGLDKYAGINLLINALAKKNTIAFVDSKSTLDHKVNELLSLGCDSISCTPTMWRLLLSSNEFKSLDLKQCSIGGEIADQNILDDISTAFPNASIVHIYATTETGFVFYVSDRKSGFPQSYLSDGQIAKKIAVSESGCLIVKKQRLFEGYIGQENSAGHTDDHFQTKDKVELREGRYHFIGREDGQINIGGKKVHPEEVERVLVEHPNILNAAVKSKLLLSGVNIIEAKVATKERPDDSSRFVIELKNFCRIRLDKYKIPTIFILDDSDMLSPSGKIDRNFPS